MSTKLDYYFLTDFNSISFNFRLLIKHKTFKISVSITLSAGQVIPVNKSMLTIIAILEFKILTLC